MSPRETPGRELLAPVMNSKLAMSDQKTIAEGFAPIEPLGETREVQFRDTDSLRQRMLIPHDLVHLPAPHARKGAFAVWIINPLAAYEICARALARATLDLPRLQATE